MPKIEGYSQFGGIHWESAAIRNVLTYVGAKNPHTGAPFTEAMIFGLAGGIGAGYACCPSIPRDTRGSGVAIAGRAHVVSTNEVYARTVMTRLGGEVRITESTSEKKAFKNLVEEIASGTPPLIHSSRALIPYEKQIVPAINWWSYGAVVFDVDEARGTALVGDIAASAIEVPLDRLASSRGQTCTHKNRTIALLPPKKIGPLKDACLAALRETIAGQRKPYIKTYSLIGLAEWPKHATSKTDPKGWHKILPGGLLYLGLRDLYISIETDTGGGLYRPLFADFLDEAAAITGRKALTKVAELARENAAMWTDIAVAQLPNAVKPLKKTREALNKRRDAYVNKGVKGLAEVEKQNVELAKLSAECVAEFPLNQSDTDAMLASFVPKIEAIVAAEWKLIEALESAVK
jgi:hypothetical protein